MGGSECEPVVVSRRRQSAQYNTNSILAKVDGTDREYSANKEMIVVAVCVYSIDWNSSHDDEDDDQWNNGGTHLDQRETKKKPNSLKILAIFKSDIVLLAKVST